ncbi:MAG: HK97 family phage prohead protease [bacterium]
MNQKFILNTPSNLELFEENEDKKPYIEGYAILFNKESKPRPYIVIFKDGSITPELIENSDIRLLLNHDSNYILGRYNQTTRNFSIELDDLGVKFRYEPNETTLSKDVYENVKLGNYSQCSFACTFEDYERETKDDIEYLYVNKINQLLDFSIVAYPAFEDTTAEAFSELIKKENTKINSANKQFEFLKKQFEFKQKRILL